MDFIVGGCHQGKTQYARDAYGYNEEDIVDGELLQEPDMMDRPCLNHFHLLVRQLLERDVAVEEFLERLFAENDIAVVIADEIGCGIVPVDAFERAYRETAGRQCCVLARRAAQVYRITAGIACRIK